MKAIIKAAAFAGLIGWATMTAACASAEPEAAADGAGGERSIDAALDGVRRDPEAARIIQLRLAQGGIHEVSERGFANAKALARRVNPTLAVELDAMTLADLQRASASIAELAATATPAEFADYLAQSGLTAAGTRDVPAADDRGVKPRVGAVVVVGAGLLFVGLCWATACWWNGDGFTLC